MCPWWRAIVAGLIGCASALPAVAFPASAPAPVRLLAPAGGEVLQAGSLAELAWEPRRPFSRLEHVEEWEAFLSLDGGAHYTVRITPHLDLGLRRMLWRVPPAPTGDARLLLRFGDEHLETVFELPQRFTIAGPAEPRLDVVPMRLSLRRGEAARPGQTGVVAWVEGDRNGGASHPVAAAEPATAQPPPSIEESGAESVVAEVPSPPRDPVAALAAAWNDPLSSRRAVAACTERTPLSASLSILLLTSRRNE